MQKALYFMPDISSFTEFVNNTELEHSIHIVSELLEILIDNANIDLELVEIEGDALFMFTIKIPNYEDLWFQTSTMLKAFHNHTKNYETILNYIKLFKNYQNGIVSFLCELILNINKI